MIQEAVKKVYNSILRFQNAVIFLNVYFICGFLWLGACWEFVGTWTQIIGCYFSKDLKLIFLFFIFFLNPTKEATQFENQLLLLKHGVRWESDRTDLQLEMPSVTRVYTRHCTCYPQLKTMGFA